MFTLNKKITISDIVKEDKEKERAAIIEKEKELTFKNRIITSIQKLMNYTQNRNAKSRTGKLGHCFGVKEIYNILDDNEVAIFLYNNNFFKKMKGGRWFINWNYCEDNVVSKDRNIIGLLTALNNRSSAYDYLIKPFIGGLKNEIY